MDDNLYPNDGGYFLPREPKDQIIERKKERADVLQALSELKGIVNRLDERIAFYESNSSIPDEVRAEPDKFLILHNTYSLIAKNLKDEREYIEALLNDHIKDL